MHTSFKSFPLAIAFMLPNLAGADTIEMEEPLAVEGPSVWVQTDPFPKLDFEAPSDAIIGDWNQDGSPDIAVYRVNKADDLANISIFEGAPDGGLYRVVEISRGFLAWLEFNGLTPRSETSFSVSSGNMNGRSKWGRETFISYRDGRYVVAGIETWAYDGFVAESSERCSWNLRTGVVERTKGDETSTQSKSTENVGVWDLPISRFPELEERILAVCYAE